MKIALVVSYDGSGYKGFQKQPQGYAVQNILEQALAKLFLTPILTTAAGRTDASVHADEQYVIVTLPTALSVKMGLSKGLPQELPQKLPKSLPDRLSGGLSGLSKLRTILNNRLPPTIRIVHLFKVAADFHPRFHALVRLYEYSLFCNPHTHIPAHTLTKSYRYPFPFDKHHFINILHAFEGTHDFTTFASAQDAHHSKVRTLYKIDCIEKGHELIIELYGNAFLREMVRSIIGNALMLARTLKSSQKSSQKSPQKSSPQNPYQKSSQKSPQEASQQVNKLLSQKDPTCAKARVPGHALTLKRVFYTPLFRVSPQPLASNYNRIWT